MNIHYLICVICSYPNNEKQTSALKSFYLIQNERKATEFCHMLKGIRRGANAIGPVFFFVLIVTTHGHVDDRGL